MDGRTPEPGQIGKSTGRQRLKQLGTQEKAIWWRAGVVVNRPSQCRRPDGTARPTDSPVQVWATPGSVGSIPGTVRAGGRGWGDGGRGQGVSLVHIILDMRVHIAVWSGTFCSGFISICTCAL